MRSLIPLLPIAFTAALAIGGCDRQSPAAEQANQSVQSAPENSAAPAIPKAGEIDRSHKGEAMPTAAFNDMDGKPHSMAEFKGKPVLLNLWATWCAPCVAEMPALDTLAGRADSPRIVAVSQDFEGKDKVAPFVAKTGLKNIKPFLDKETSLSTGLGANLPTTILYDSAGKEVWRTSGETDWTSDKIKTALAEAK